MKRINEVIETALVRTEADYTEIERDLNVTEKEVIAWNIHHKCRFLASREVEIIFIENAHHFMRDWLQPGEATKPESVELCRWWSEEQLEHEINKTVQRYFEWIRAEDVEANKLFNSLKHRFESND